MVISDDGRRLGLGGHLGAAEERLGRGQVPPFTKQYVDLCRNTLSVGSNGAPTASVV